jgi:serine/threonine-protein kinase
MGEVYVAMHLRTQRRVAVKMLHGHLVEDPAVLDRFQREAEVTGQLGSDHIVGVIDVDRDDGQPFIVLELVEGESLGARIDARGPLALDEIVELLDQLAAGLDVAHRAGIVHRDLKPENIYLCPRRDGGFKLKILDFGVSKIRGSASAITHEVAIVGTPDYMSPEQAQGHADEVDATSDVFAVGGLTYKCLTGKRPFHGDSVPALLRSICDDEPAPIGSLRADVPPAVSSVIALAMAKHTDERYRSVADFARDLRAAIAGTLDAAVIERSHGLSHGRPSQRRRKRPSTIDVTGETHRG